MSNQNSSRTFSFLRTLGSTAVRAGHEAIKSKISNLAQSEKFQESAAALRLVQGLDSLKGAAMKVGQLLSMVDESMLPPGWKNALEKLQSSATPRTWECIEPLLATELPNYKKLFLSIDPLAVHAASIGQVHKAIHHTGAHVALKIRYPGLTETVHSDLEQLKKFLSLTRLMPQKSDFSALFESVEQMFLQELDFNKEAHYYELYKNHFEGNVNYIVPKLYKDASNSSVLTTEWIDGINIEKWLRQIDSEPDNSKQEKKNALGEKLLNLLFSELFQMGHMQSDPNPANFLVTPHGKLALLDFGATQIFSTQFATDYANLSKASSKKDNAEIISCALKMKILIDSDSADVRNTLLKMMELISEPFAENNFNWKNCQLARRIKDASIPFALQTRFRAPPSEMAFVNRRILGNQLFLESLGCSLNAKACLSQYIDL